MSTDKNDIITRFNVVSKQIDTYNRQKSKRFFAMTHGRRDKLTEIGVYDGKTKKYVLTDVRAHDACAIVSEMEQMLKRAK